ncbi:hypothetical protein LTR65_008491 [Meristemomyces frigidus]
MLLKRLAISGSLFAASVSTLPTPKALKPRAVVDGHGGFYVCTDRNFNGKCIDMIFAQNQCYLFPSDYRLVQSARADEGFSCNLYLSVPLFTRR